MRRLFGFPILLVALLAITGCTAKPDYGQANIVELTRAIQALGPDVSPAEAERAANIAYRHSVQLAQAYNVTDPPILHNTKVHNGSRTRGLCNHYTEDMLKRLRRESFSTLSLHWATSPSTAFRIVHHSAVISRKGDRMQDGILLDPWRHGGALFWAPVRKDERYNWQRLQDVQDLLRSRLSRTPRPTP